MITLLIGSAILKKNKRTVRFLSVSILNLQYFLPFSYGWATGKQRISYFRNLKRIIL